MIVHTANRDIDETWTCGVLAIDPAATCWTEVAGVDVPALCFRRIRAGLAFDGDIVFLETSERHVAGAWCALAILAVALAHAERLCIDRVGDRTTQAAAGDSHVRHIRYSEVS